MCFSLRNLINLFNFWDTVVKKLFKMRVEMPVCKRCCFCIPLRYGLLVWGYLKLFTSIIVLIGLCFELKSLIDYQIFMTGAEDMVITCIGIIILIADIALSITFIVGCHQKNIKLLKVFYIYSIILYALLVVLQVYNLIETIISLKQLYKLIGDLSFDVWKYPVLELIMYLTDFMLQIYLIILVKSEIIKLNNSYQFQFTNNATEAECTLKVEDVEEIKSEEEIEHNYIHDEKINHNIVIQI